MDTTTRIERVKNREGIPSSVEGGRQTGALYAISDATGFLGFTAQIGFYANTWSAWTPVGSFLAEVESRKAAIALLRIAANAAAEYARQQGI